MLILGVVFFGIFTVVSGPLAEKWGRRKFLLGVTAGIFVFGALWFTMFGPGQAAAMVGLIVGFTLMGLTFGPMAAILPELFPPTSATPARLWPTTSPSVHRRRPGVVHCDRPVAGCRRQHLAGWRVHGLAAVLTFMALWLTRETKDTDYENNVA
jgi:hypothetical protein